MARKEISTDEFSLPQKNDIDLSLDKPLIHGEGLPNLTYEQELVATLAFMEEPVMICIQESSSGGDFPETYVPVQVNGKGAEVMMNGKWVEMTWLPIGPRLITKRKYVEVLARSRSDSIKTMHEDATAANPRNWERRILKSAYPVSILEDKNPRGGEWFSRIMMSH